jgi:protein phosphatase
MPSSALDVANRSDPGMVRAHNEDAIFVDGSGLAILADGMGGYNAGEVASGIAVKTITNLVREAFVGQELDGIAMFAPARFCH